MTKRRKARRSVPTVERTPLACRIEEARLERGWSKTELARQVGLGWTTTRVSDYESGEKQPLADAVARLVSVLGISADWLLLGEGSMFRGQTRSAAKLDDDIRAMIAREVGTRFDHPDVERISSSDLDIDVRLSIDAIATAYADELRRTVQTIEQLAHSLELDGTYQWRSWELMPDRSTDLGERELGDVLYSNRLRERLTDIGNSRVELLVAAQSGPVRLTRATVATIVGRMARSKPTMSRLFTKGFLFANGE